MTGRCPHLGLAGNRQQVFLLPNSRHRCYVRGQPERVGSEHQGSICLTSAYRRCPRLVANAEARWPETEAAEVSEPLEGRARRRWIPAPAVVEAEAAPAPEEEPARLTDLQALRKGKARARRPLTVTELVVLLLLAGILVSVSFVGYAFLHRLRIGPGLAVPTGAVAAAPTMPPEPSPTMVPTFTATPQATATEVPAELPPPTPIPEPTLPLVPTPSRPAASSPPTRLVIESINLDVPVRPVGIKMVGEGASARAVWGDLPNAAAFHYTSAFPGNVGNTVINGHRDIYKAVFRHLDRVKVGDEIQVYVGDTVYPYEVTGTLVVPETFATAEQQVENQRLIGYLPEERLTLITCTPVGLATHRLLVIAKPPAEVLPEMPEAGDDGS